MKKLNPIERSQYINNRFKEYLRSSFQFGKGKLQKLFENQLDQEELFKGPYVDLNLPFKRGKSLDGLMNEGLVCKSFSKLSDINFERPLYSHQEESLRNIGSGRSAIITTGTGSGKTESFLYPILNDLLSEIEKGNKDVGIRAIFLYPMNALVNDQMDRLRKILLDCPEIKYGFFTGDTKESVPANYRKKYGEDNGLVIPDNELVSREEIRENPPHLLFTNYSMLEYLLIRPNDYAIFVPARLKNWKYVVLDEAHTYSGAKGIELSMLMRRLTGLAPEKPSFILTSATLGEKGKSENEIIEFAKNLTSASFDVQDIIFSKRIPLKKDDLDYRITGSDYIRIKENIKDYGVVKSIGDSYKKIEFEDFKEYLFELLSSDNNVYDIYSILKDGCKTIGTILDGLNSYVSDLELIALIDLINLAEKNNIGLFDLKYHSFVRPLSGAYINLSEDPKIMLTKTNYIDGLKAFEIGNCRFCGSPYIVGKIQHNDTDQLDYLFQNQEVDIYENYGNNEYIKLDFFLMENAVNEDEYDKSNLEEYVICVKCGSLHHSKNLNSRKCTCDTSFHKIIYRVGQSNTDDKENLNNITQCPCCGDKGRSGVVKTVNLGKDEGTAIVAQTLFEAIGDDSEKTEKTGKLSLKLKDKNESIKLQDKVKQFLAFSDSRQQASFAAVFLDSNHVRMLRKRLIWNVIEDQNYRDIAVDELASYLSSTIKTKDLFSNDLTAHKNAWVTILIDLLRVDGAYDGEGLGLFYFAIDLRDILDRIDDEDIHETFGRYNIDKNDLATIIQVAFNIFKTTPAVSYIKSTLTPDEKKEYMEYRRFDNYVMYNCQKSIKGIRSLLPIKGGENKIIRYLKKVCKCSNEEAAEILDIIFNSLAVGISGIEGTERLMIKHDKEEAYQIDSSKYILKNYKNSNYYQCSKCGKLTPHNVHDVCTQDKCDGMLVEIDPDQVLGHNYYRSQYKTKKIERIVIKEHTAQLNRSTAKEYQMDFKSKKINILSSSTTFEMGIDIGDLENVYMRNIPPSPANYVQRAGRAGRSKDTAAYILTYCSNSSHDYTYFSDPEKMIKGVIRPPYFNVFNDKIVVRHLMATCLGSFFRTYPVYFNTIDGLVFKDGYKVLKDYINSHPDDLNKYINEKIIPEEIYLGYHNFKWFDEMNGDDEKMSYFIDTIQQMATEYEEAKNNAISEENYSEADYYKKQIENLHKLGVIESLSDYSIIPKYGFPVNVVDLQIYQDGKIVKVYKNGRVDEKYNLSRDLKIAISEYAPDSEVITDGNKYTSKYISLPKATEFPKRYFSTCTNCKKVNVYISSSVTINCKYCGEKLDTNNAEYYIEPKNGFKTGLTKESSRMKPKKSYSGEVSYLGGGIKDEDCMDIGKTIKLESSRNDNLLILNKSNFHMCPICGYSDVAKGKNIYPQIFKKHKNFRAYDCPNETLDKLRLGHQFQTDVVRFTIPLLGSGEKTSYSIALSFLYAFLEGVSNALDIERNDINGILELNLEKNSYDILLYDNVPGGAGHVKSLMNSKAVVDSLRWSLKKVSQKCCDENTSCYNCLRNYNNQSHHSRLQRIYAKNVIEQLLTDIAD